MRSTARWFALAGALMLVGSCSTVSYVTDWDTQHDFSGYTSFAWFELPPHPRGGQPAAPGNQLIANRIRRSVTSELSAKGLSSQPTGEADLLVSYFVVLQPRMVMYHTGWGYPYPYRGWGWGYGWGGGASYGRTYTEGTLVVDVLDASGRALVWRGMAQGAFTRPNPSDEHVAKVVSRLLQGFPPA